MYDNPWIVVGASIFFLIWSIVNSISNERKCRERDRKYFANALKTRLGDDKIAVLRKMHVDSGYLNPLESSVDEAKTVLREITLYHWNNRRLQKGWEEIVLEAIKDES
jgi:hypothetical protein